MILSEFYYGKKEISRIYHKGKIIWEKNSVCTIGQLISTLCGIALPTVESTENISMYTINALSGIAMPENMNTDILAYANIVGIGNVVFEEYEPIVVIANIDGNLITDVIPSSVDVKHGFGSAIGQLTCVALPTSFGLVFTRGNVDCESTAIVIGRSTETTYASGNVVYQIVCMAIPVDEDMLHIYMPVNSEIVNISIPRIQEPEQINMITTMELVSLASPMTLLNCNVVFKNDITKLYETKVLEGYSCKDPVEVGIIPVPTKSATVSHTYKYSGWSRTENGMAEDLGSITDDTIFYATFDAFIRYYTVNFYLDNNLVSTQEVAYGEIAVAPNISKEGYIIEWVPNNLTIYGDTDFYGVWTRDYIVVEQTASFTYDSDMNTYKCNISTVKPMENGQTYIVVWDGKEHSCDMREIKYKVNNENITSISMNNCIGNATTIKTFFGYGLTPQEDDTGEPFLIFYSNESVSIYTQETNSSHTVSVYAV